MTKLAPDLTVLPEHIAEDVDRSTIESFAEAAWFAWRTRDRRSIDITNGVWWTDDGRRVLSLAMGTDLHSWGAVDWETYVFVGAEDGFGDDICCHESREAADACALTFLIHGRFCREVES